MQTPPPSRRAADQEAPERVSCPECGRTTVRRVLLMRDRVYLRCGTCAKVWDIPNRRRVPQPPAPDAPATSSSQPSSETDLLAKLKEENEALRYAAVSFGDLAERLNDALREERERRRLAERRSRDEQPG